MPARPTINPIDVVIASAVSEVAQTSTASPIADGNSNTDTSIRGMVRLVPSSQEANASLQQRIDVNWNGAIEPLARLTARFFSYDYSAETNRPSSPVTVNLSLSGATLLDVIAATNHAARGQARLDIGESRSLRLTYAR